MGLDLAIVGSLLPQWQWVPEFFEARLPADSATIPQHKAEWRVIQRFLLQHGLHTPAMVQREHGLAFVVWRSQGVARVTALHNLRIFSMIMSEAKQRGLCESNPIRALRLKLGPTHAKPEISRELEQAIRDEIERQGGRYRDFLRVSMEIALYQGARLAETRIHLSNVDFDRDRLTLFIKGARVHTTQLHPKVKAILLPIRQAGGEWSYDEPSQANRMSNVWHVFLQPFRAAQVGLCFHSFRVTCITRLARAGVTESKCMKFIGHKSLAIHRIYQRLQVDDLNDCIAALT